MRPPLLTVMVVSGGGFQGLGILKLLAESGQIRAVLVDCFEDNVSRHFAHAFHRVPEIAAGRAFVEALLHIGRLEQVDLVLPSTEKELLPLAQVRSRFAEAGIWLGVCDTSFIQLAQDKRALYARLSDEGLPVLPVVDPSKKGASLPIIGKPLDGWGGRNQIVLHTAEDLKQHRLAEIADTHVFQPLLENAEELSVDFGIDSRGVASAFGIRRRVRTAGGFAVISDSVDHPRARALMESFARCAGDWGARGLFNVQILVDGDALYLSDVNARLGTSAAQWCGSGFNPALHVCAAEAPLLNLRSGAPPSRRRVVRHLQELVLHPPESGSAETPIRGVVFDLDDTLIPQKRWVLAKLRLLLETEPDGLPKPEVFWAEATRRVEEGPWDRLFDVLGDHFGWDEDRTRRLIAAYRAVRPETCPVYPDVLPVLDTLRRNGLRLGILADNPPESQRYKLEAAALDDAFDAVVLSRDAGHEKPDPAGFAAVATELGLEPGQLVMVGDNPYRDMLGAARSGFARGFLIHRQGGFFNFDPTLFTDLLHEPWPVDRIASLTELVTRLSSVTGRTGQDGP